MKSVVAIQKAQKQNRAALIGYLPVGFPTLAGTVEAARVLVDNGVDVIELGFPYSDPGMDGPIIQQATAIALTQGTSIDDLFKCVETVANTGVATMVMTYWNPVFRRGVERFAQELAEVGGAGLITPDLPPEEGQEWEAAAQANDLEATYLVAPSSSAQRLALISNHTKGWVYAASTMGVTGTRDRVDNDVQGLVERTRKAGAQLVCVGLGVSTRSQCQEISRYADGVIVGSALVKTLFHQDYHTGLTQLSALTQELYQGTSKYPERYV